MYFSMYHIKQGAHYREKSGKTGNFVKKIPCMEKSGNLEKMGKINFTKTCQGNIREFSAIYILIVSPFSRMGKLSGKNQGICFTKLSGHPD